MEHFGSKRGLNAYLIRDNAGAMVCFMVKRGQVSASTFPTREEALTRIAKYIETGRIS